MEDLDTSDQKQLPSQDIESNGAQAVNVEQSSAPNQGYVTPNMASTDDSLSRQQAENIGAMRESEGHDEATTFKNRTALAVNNQAEDEEKTQVANGSPKTEAEETKDQKPKAEELPSATTRRQGRRPRHQRSEAAASKLAELGVKNNTTASPATSHLEARTSHVQSVERAEEAKEIEDQEMPETFSSIDGQQPSRLYALEEPSMVHEPSQRFITTSIVTQSSPQYPARAALPPITASNTTATTYRPSASSDKTAFKDASSELVDYSLPTLELTPGAVSTLGRAFGAPPRQNPPPSTTSSAPPNNRRRLSLFRRQSITRTAGSCNTVTAKAVDNAEAVFYAEDVELDNSARNTRLMVCCAVVGAMVVIVAVSLGVLLTRDTSQSDGDPRCKLEPGEVNVVVNCKCRNTTELYRAALSSDEIAMYHELLKIFSDHEIFLAYTDEDVEMSSCSPQNQAVLEMASFKGKGLTPEDAKRAREELDVDRLLGVYSIFIFFIQMDGDSWENKENWLEDYNLCEWFGVTCSSTVRTSSLVLRSNGLAGTLPNELHLLTHLFELDLSDNGGIHGPLPAEFMSKANRLHVLRLENLRLSGTIPGDVRNMARLSTLLLRNNSLSGTIPSGLGETALSYFDCNDNNLTGSIPTELGNLTQMHDFKVAGNMLTGTIPSEIGKLTNLELLELSFNKFEGTLPAFLGTLPRLDTLLISQSGFSGPIPDTFCEREFSAIIIEANCGQKDGNETDVIIPTCTCCDREKSRLIQCDEDLLLNSFIF